MATIPTKGNRSEISANYMYINCISTVSESYMYFWIFYYNCLNIKYRVRNKLIRFLFFWEVLLLVSSFYYNLENKYLPKVVMLIMLNNAYMLASGLSCNAQWYMCWTELVLDIHVDPGTYRAVFCVVGRCDPAEDHSEIADKIDDYLWIKLSQIQVDSDPSRQDGFTLQRLQSLLYEDFGKFCHLK